MQRITLTSTISLIGTKENSNGIENEASDFDYNRTQVINCFASIETDINQLIVHDFLGLFTLEKKKQFEKFKSKIVHTSWFNFNEKRKMAQNIICECIESNEEKKKIEKSMRKIMSYRNALIHGNFYTDGIKSELRYYEGEYKTVLLDSNYWNKVKDEFKFIFDLMNLILKEKGILL